MRFYWTPITLTKLRKLAKTHTMKQAAEAIGCTENNVKSKAKSLGISFRKYGENHHSANYKDKSVEEARRLVESGLSKAEAGRITGIPRHAVSEYCNFKYRNNDAIKCF